MIFSGWAVLAPAVDLADHVNDLLHGEHLLKVIRNEGHVVKQVRTAVMIGVKPLQLNDPPLQVRHHVDHVTGRALGTNLQHSKFTQQQHQQQITGSKVPQYCILTAKTLFIYLLNLTQVQ